MKKTPIIVGIVGLVIVVAGWLILRGGFDGEQVGGKQTITVSGSSSGITILGPMAEAFEGVQSNATIRFLPGTSTGDGVRGVAEGLLDIGSAARLIKASEREEYPQVSELTYVEDALVLGVNPSVTVDNLTSQQIKDIHSGAVINWSEVGGSDQTIIVLDREESESSKILLREHILGPDLVITNRAALLRSSGSMNKTIENTPGAIGQTSLGVINLEGLNIKPLALNSVVPSVATIRNGTYPLVRKYGVLWLEGELSSMGQAFIDFISSVAARDVLLRYEFVPVAE